MKHVLNTIFLEDCINNVDPKYHDFIKASEECYFSYANLFDFPHYYKLFTLKKNADYNLNNKILNQKTFEVIKLLIEKIQENNYQKNDILTLYSFICHLMMHYYLEDYVNFKANTINTKSKKRKMRKTSKVYKHIEAQIYEERYNKKISKYKIKNIDIADSSLKLISDICSKIYYFSIGIDLFTIGYKNFKKFQNKNNKRFRKIKMIRLKLMDSLTKSKQYSAASIYNIYTSNKDYLNKENIAWNFKKEEITYSFYNLYQEMAFETTKLLNIISEEIFYKTKNDKAIKKIIEKIKK